MPKKRLDKREGVSISFNTSVLEKLDNFCKKNFNAERSSVVEEAVKEFLAKKEKSE